MVTILKQLIHTHHFGLAIRSSNLMETHLKPQSELRIIIKTYLEHSYQNTVFIKDSISRNSQIFNEKLNLYTMTRGMRQDIRIYRTYGLLETVLFNSMFHHSRITDPV